MLVLTNVDSPVLRDGVTALVVAVTLCVTEGTAVEDVSG